MGTWLSMSSRMSLVYSKMVCNGVHNSGVHKSRLIWARNCDVCVLAILSSRLRQSNQRGLP